MSNQDIFFVNDANSVTSDVNSDTNYVTVLYGTNVMYLTLQNKFLEDLRFQKLLIFITPGTHGFGKEKLPF